MPDDQVAPTETAGTEPETTNAANTEATAPVKAPPVIVQDQWSQKTKETFHAISGDLELTRRLDALLARPILQQQDTTHDV